MEGAAILTDLGVCPSNGDEHDARLENIGNFEVAIVGEPGVGKSRLVWEVTHWSGGQAGVE